MEILFVIHLVILNPMLYLNKIKPLDFTQLSDEKQMEVIWERGVFVSEKCNKQYKYILYNVDGFYIVETRDLKWNIRCDYRCTDCVDLFLHPAQDETISV